MSAPRRNVELKAVDRDPAATLAAALAAGAQDQGVLVQRDTYFAVPRGRLKLREEGEGPGRTATLIAYARPDESAARVSAYHLIGVADPDVARAGLEATAGVKVVVAKRRRLLLHGCVRIHLDDVDGLEPHLELEGVVGAGTDDATAAAEVAALRSALGVVDADLRPGSYSDALAPQADPELLAAARAAMDHAYAPYSALQVGAAVRADDGRVYAGANVENAAYPQGNCAEASALAAMATAGGRRVSEVVVASSLGVTPCGGCRQRLKEFGGPGLLVHVADGERVRQTLTLAELFPHAFAAEDLP